MVKNIILAGLTASLLAGCASTKGPSKMEIESISEAAVAITPSKRINELTRLPPVDGELIPVAVYKFSDLTSQRNPGDNFAELSTAVTQGSEVFIIKALQDAGKGTWFKVVERVNIDNLIKERQLIRSQRETYEGAQAKPLQPLIVTGLIIEGGIVGYDSNIVSGGLGARLLGIGVDKQYRKDEVTVILRLVSVNTGEVLLSTGVTKTVFSTAASGNMLKFIDLGTTAVEFEAGTNINEPTTYAVRIAVEQAVTEMIKEGARKELWKFKKKK